MPENTLIGEIVVTPAQPKPAETVLVEVRRPDGQPYAEGDPDAPLIRINGVTGARQYLQFARAIPQCLLVVAEQGEQVERQTVTIPVQPLEVPGVGTAPGTPVHVIRVMNALGLSRQSDLIAALDLITSRKLENPARPVVVNLSVGAYVGSEAFTALDDAVQATIDAGVTVIVSAGNDGADAANFSPAHVADAITVGASDKGGKLAGYSNTGRFIDILAPGDRIETLLAGSDRLVREYGTSMAAPHVTGAVVVLLGRAPGMTPEEVRDALVAAAKKEDKTDKSGTTRALLNMKHLGGKP